MNKTPSIDEYVVFLSLTLMSRLPQPLKQLLPMEVTPSGITIEVREEQSWKQKLPREVRVDGRVIEVRALHLLKH